MKRSIQLAVAFTLNVLCFVMLVVGCRMYVAPYEGEPTTGPPLPRVSKPDCILDDTAGDITIWYAGPENVPAFACATKVTVILFDGLIEYDGQTMEFGEVYTLIDDKGYVFTQEDVLNGEWPDTVGGGSGSEEPLFDGETSNLSPDDQQRIRELLEYAATRTQPMLGEMR